MALKITKTIPLEKEGIITCKRRASSFGTRFICSFDGNRLGIFNNIAIDAKRTSTGGVADDPLLLLAVDPVTCEVKRKRNYKELHCLKPPLAEGSPCETSRDCIDRCDPVEKICKV